MDINQSIIEAGIKFFQILLPTFVGGFITLWVYRKFEFDRIRVNNINDMHKVVLPAIQKMSKSLGLTMENLKDLENHTTDIDIKKVINNLRDSLFDYNSIIDSYELELSSFLDRHEYFLVLSKVLVDLLEEDENKLCILERNKIDLKEEYQAIELMHNILINLSEDITELTRDALNGKVCKYWKKKLKPGYDKKTLKLLEEVNKEK